MDGVETLSWTWDAEHNAIVFDAPPVDGQRVEVLYTVPLVCEGVVETDATDTGGTPSDTATSDTAPTDTADSGP